MQSCSSNFAEVRMPFQSKRSAFGVLVSLCLSLASQAQWAPANPVKDVQQQPDGVQVTMGTGTLKLQICTDEIIHVLYSPTASIPQPQRLCGDQVGMARRKVHHAVAADNITISTASLRLVVSKIDGSITYQDVDGKQIVQEANRKLTPTGINGENTYRAESFMNIYGSSEAIYGLGQHQAGVWNYRGDSVDISQDNTAIAVPFLVSSNGYGIFWNNASRSRFNNRFANSLYSVPK